MSTLSGPRAEYWFGKRSKLPGGTVVGSDAKGREGIVSQSGKWFSLDWWFGSAKGPGHYAERTNDGQFGEGRHRERRAAFGGSSGLGRRSSSTPAADAKRRQGVEYAAYCHERFQAAEKATNGYMVTPAAKARGIHGDDFFDPDARRRPSMKWASDELRSWFGHGSAAAGEKGSRGGLLSTTAYASQSAERGRS